MHHTPEKNHRFSTRHGFTLLELMLSIGIFGAVMAVVAQGMASASSSSSTLQIAADLQSEANVILDRIATDMRGARFPTPPATGTTGSSISFQPIPAFSSTTSESDLFAGADTITIANPTATPTLLTRNLNGSTTTTLTSKVPASFPVSASSLGLTAGTTLTGFFISRVQAKSLRLYLSLSDTDHTGQTITRYAVRDIPTYN